MTRRQIYSHHGKFRKQQLTQRRLQAAERGNMQELWSTSIAAPQQGPGSQPDSYVHLNRGKMQ